MEIRYAPEMSAAHENPFRTSRLLALPPHWGDGESAAMLIARWHAAGRRGALVGPHGTGKTSRLRALAAHLQKAEGLKIIWVQWHDDGTTTPEDWRSALAVADVRTVVCLDGSENLGLLGSYQLLKYSRRAAGILATRHRASLFLPTLARHRPDADLFVAQAATLAPGAERAARKAFADARGNAHEAFRRLYLTLRKRPAGCLVGG
jgi:hypothetical protein